MAWTFQDDRPIWIQLTEQLTTHIVTGRYAQGSRLPAVRDLASLSGVNPNTAQRALAQLEADGLAVSGRNTGRTVTEDATVVQQVRSRMAQTLAQHYLQSMLELGFAPDAAIAHLQTTTAMQEGEVL